MALSLNGNETLTLDSNGSFTFQMGFDEAAGYQVAVSTQPAEQLIDDLK